MAFDKFAKNALLILVSLSLLATALVSKEFLFPFITTKAFYFRIVLELALPFYVYLLLKHREYRPSLKNPLNWLLLTFLVLNLLSAIFGVNLIRSLWGNFERMGGVFYLAHLVLLYFFVLMLGQIGGKYIQRFFKALLAVSALITLNGISGMLGGPTLTLDPSLPGRASSTLGNPIFFASFLILPLFLSIFFVLQAEKLPAKIFYWFLAALQLIGIIQSGTRGAVVGLVLGIFVSAIIYVAFAGSRKVKMTGLSLLLGFFVIVLILFTFHDRLPKASTLSRVFNLRDSNANARLIQWRIALKGVKDYPLLGTGPENYYVVGNKYYDNELYRYDRSWFDKPHNFLLEILITTGVLGFAVYLGLLFAGFWILWQAHKRELLSWLEVCALFAGLVVYQVQNLFVFDTIPASLMFYAFLGLIGFLYSEVQIRHQKQGSKATQETRLPPSLVAVSTGLAGLLAIYLIAATNITPARVSKSVNYGYAYAAVDPHQAAKYFETATTLPFNFDLSETASKFSDFATSLVRSPLAASDPAFVDEQLSKAVAYQKQAADKAPNDPVVLQKLVNDYLYLAVFHKTAIDPEAMEIIRRAIDLAPKRVEARLALAQLRQLQGSPEEAAKIAEEVSSLDPTNQETRWQLAMVYYDAKRREEAFKLAEELLSSGSEPPAASDLSWLIAYYVQKNDAEKAIRLAERNLQANPANATMAARLYFVYKQFGREDKIKALLDAYKKTEPQAWPEFEKLIQPSPGQAKSGQ